MGVWYVYACVVVGVWLVKDPLSGGSLFLRWFGSLPAWGYLYCVGSLELDRAVVGVALWNQGRPPVGVRLSLCVVLLLVRRLLRAVVAYWGC